MGGIDIKGFLKQMRKTSGLSASDVADQLKAYGMNISPKTIYGYENSDVNAMPNADVFLALCKIYNCDNPLDMFNSITLNQREESVIEDFRALDLYGQDTVVTILKREKRRVESISELEKHAAGSVSEGTFTYPYLHKIASAGVGFYFDDIPTDTITVPQCEGADFVIGVNGDSMMPDYADGDLVYVQKCQTVDVGHIGIFIVDNEYYIKEAGPDGLISRNPKYPMIPGSDQIQCVGKVLGKVSD